eukprot:jgi/Mesvir1/22000/Mv11642-RA.1
MEQTSPRNASSAIPRPAGSPEYYVGSRESKSRALFSQQTSPHNGDALASGAGTDDVNKGGDKAAGMPGQPRRTGRKWAEEEDRRLLQLVKDFPHDQQNYWQNIANAMRVKNAKQCRERYNNHLRPGLIKGADFTPEEDAQLIALHQKWGNRWSHIAKFMPGRPENDLKNRFYAASRCLGTRRPTRGRSRRCTLKKYIQRTGCIKMKVTGGGGMGHTRRHRRAGTKDADESLSPTSSAAAGIKRKYPSGGDPPPRPSPILRSSSCLSTVQYEGNVCQGPARPDARDVRTESPGTSQPWAIRSAPVVKFGPNAAGGWPSSGAGVTSVRHEGESSLHNALFAPASFDSAHSLASGRESEPKRSRVSYLSDEWASAHEGMYAGDVGGYPPSHRAPAAQQGQVSRTRGPQPLPPRGPIVEAADGLMWVGLPYSKEFTEVPATPPEVPTMTRQPSASSVCVTMPPQQAQPSSGAAACRGVTRADEAGSGQDSKRASAMTAELSKLDAEVIALVLSARNSAKHGHIDLRASLPEPMRRQVELNGIPGTLDSLVDFIYRFMPGQMDLRPSLQELNRRPAEMDGTPGTVRRPQPAPTQPEAPHLPCCQHAPGLHPDAWPVGKGFAGGSTSLGMDVATHRKANNSSSSSSYGTHGGAEGEDHGQAGQGRGCGPSHGLVQKVRLARAPQQGRDAQGAPGWVLTGADGDGGDVAHAHAAAGSLHDETWFHPTFDYDSCSYVTSSVVSAGMGAGGDVTVLGDQLSCGSPRSDLAGSGGMRYQRGSGGGAKPGLQELLSTRGKRVVSFLDKREKAHPGDMLPTWATCDVLGAAAGDAPAGMACDDPQQPMGWPPLGACNLPRNTSSPRLMHSKMVADEHYLADSGSAPRCGAPRDNIVVTHAEMAAEQLEAVVMQGAAEYMPPTSDEERGVVYMVSRIVPASLPDGKEVVDFLCYDSDASVEALFGSVCEAIREVCGRSNIFSVTIMSRIGHVPAGGLFFFFGVHARTVAVAERAAEVAGDIVFEGSKGLAIRMGIKA